MTCSYCGRDDHYISECPRTLAGQYRLRERRRQADDKEKVKEIVKKNGAP